MRNPALTDAGSLSAGANPVLTTLSFPVLTHAAEISLSDNAAFKSLVAPQLTKLDTRLLVELAPALTTLSLPALRSVGSQGVEIRTNQSLQTVDLSALVSVGGDFFFNQDTVLQELRAPQLRSVVGGLDERAERLETSGRAPRMPSLQQVSAIHRASGLERSPASERTSYARF
jgi:hypothetical protein